MRRVARAALALTLLGGGFAACDDRAVPAAASSAVRDSAGVEIVDNVGAPDAPFRLSERPVLRIGVVAGEPAYQFGRISGLARLSDGRIVVLDGMTKDLRFFSSGGEHLLSVGGEGLGPAEFHTSGTLEVLEGDTLQVGDFPWRTRFAPDGSYLSKEQAEWSRVRRLGTFYAECRLPPFLGDDIVACTPSETLREGAADVVAVGEGTYVRIPWDYSRADTLATVLRPSYVMMVRRGDGVAAMGRAGDGSVVIGTHAIGYAPSGFATFGGSPARLAAGRTDRYAIRLYDLDGTLRRIVRRTDGMRPPTPGELNPLSMIEWAPSGVDLDLLARADFSRLTPLDSVSTLRSVVIDDLNRIWGRLADPARGDGVWFDVFDDGGQYLGAVPFPERFRISQIGADFVLGVRRDENDVEFVEMYGLGGSGG